MKELIIRTVLTKPKLTLAIGLIVFLATLPGAFTLKEEFGYKAWYSEKDPLMDLYRGFEKKFGNDDSIIVAVYDPDGLLTAENLNILKEITEKLWLVPDIQRVDSIINYDLITGQNDEIIISPLVNMKDPIEMGEIKKRIAKDKLIEGLYIDKEQKLTLIQAFLRPAFEDPPNYSEITKNVEKLIEPYKRSNLQIKILGGVALSHYFKQASVTDIKTLLPLVGVLFCLILVLIYKRKSGVFLPFTVILSSIIAMMGIAGYLGKTINMMSSAAPTILLTVAIADAIHILTSYFIGRTDGLNQYSAVEYSLNKNFYPTLFTSLTTAIGFISFSTAKVKAIADMGIMIAIGVCLAWFFSFFILAPLLLFFKMEVKAKIKKSKLNFHPETLGPWIKKHKISILLTSFILMIVSIFYTMKLEVNMDPIAQFREDHELVKTVNLVSSKMGSFASMEMQIDSGKEDGIKDPLFLKKISTFEQWLKSQRLISKTYSITDIIKQLNKTFHENKEEHYKIPEQREIVAEELFFYTLGLPEGRSLNNRLSSDNRFMRLTVNWNVRDSLTANKLMDKIRDKAKSENINLDITGKMPLFHDLTDYIVNTFATSFIFAIIAITLILIIILKSFKLAIMALIPNLYPLIMGGLIYYITGNHVDVGTVIVASVCLGIAVDDSIHFLFEYRRYKIEGLSTDKSIEKLMKTTYPSLLFTTLTICVGFASFILAEYVPNARFGIMVSIILIFALWADFFVLPAILHVIDTNNNYQDGSTNGKI